MADNPFDFQPKSKEKAESRRSQAEEAKKEREERADDAFWVAERERTKNRRVGWLVMLLACSIFAAGFFLYAPQSPWSSLIGPTTSMSLKVGGVVFGSYGFQMATTGRRVL